jgi:hypothetical protein
LELFGNLQFVTSNPNTADGKFEFHDQPFVFGENELKGLKIFFQQRNRTPRPSDQVTGAPATAPHATRPQTSQISNFIIQVLHKVNMMVFTVQAHLLSLRFRACANETEILTSFSL